MIKSVLIANRGEIACRIIKTAKRLGIHTVGVYSEADKNALAVKEADEAYLLGPSPASDSYLNIPKVIEIAKETQAEAIHPGYGFLSESVEFAKACQDNGILYIGPSIKALETMGSKHKAKVFARKLEIPVIPGFEGDQKRLSHEADSLGYPLMIKAALGGGGKGMRLVNSKEGFQPALGSCQREALASFGNDEVILEKVISSPRHIEVQVFGDTFGNIVHLFERDCSLQRRHQKVMEEAPSCLSSELKEKIFKAATDLARDIHYRNAGTVEFLVDQEGHFYFMEMNTRLQVEHPVTEAITGLDLVEWQFRVASKEKLPLSQEEITFSGHALELRLFSENPEDNFKPQTGPIWIKETPENVRIDTGLLPMDRVTPYYDPLLAKLIVKGKDRSETIKLAKQALESWIILGLKTNKSFLSRLLLDPIILKNKFDINTLDQYRPPLKKVPETLPLAASLIKALSHFNNRSPWEQEDKWHLEGFSPFVFEWNCEGEIKTIQLTYSPEGWLFDSHSPIEVQITDNVLYFLNHQIPFWEREDKISLVYEEENYTLTPCLSHLITSHKSHHQDHLKAPMTGKVTLILVKEGDLIKENQPLMILEAMKMEHPIVSPREGKIKCIFYRIGDIVEEGHKVIDIEEEALQDDSPKPR